MKFSQAVVVAGLLTMAWPAFAADTDHDAHHTAVEMTPGEVRKIDKDAGKITLKHGALKNLGMPPMTMVFRVQDAAMLDQVKAGDKVQFAADKIGGQYTVTRIELQQ